MQAGEIGVQDLSPVNVAGFEMYSLDLHWVAARHLPKPADGLNVNPGMHETQVPGRARPQSRRCFPAGQDAHCVHFVEWAPMLDLKVPAGHLAHLPGDELPHP